MVELSRRGLITGLIALVAAPAIVRADSLMPVKLIDFHETRFLLSYEIMTDRTIIRGDRFYSSNGRKLLRNPEGIREILASRVKKYEPEYYRRVMELQPAEDVQQYISMNINFPSKLREQM